MAIETKSRSLSNSLLLFGPQLTRLIPSHLSEMRAKILNKGDDNKFGFIADVIRKLPSKWPVVAKSCPSLVSLAGDENLQKLVRYLDTGDVVHVDSPGNVLLAPLTVVSQIIEYIQLEGQPVNVQGFCIGFLTAATVSCAKDQSELEELVATSILLAVCIGAIIDADEQSRQDISARNTTYSVHWSSSLQNAHFQKSLESFPEAYISCLTDATRATVTLPVRDADGFLSKLMDASLSATAVGLSGRYHLAGRAEISQQLQLLCKRNVDFRLPGADALQLPLRSTTNGKLIENGLLHNIALDSILVQTCNWYDTIEQTMLVQDLSSADIVSIGGLGTVPRSLEVKTASSLVSKAHNGNNGVPHGNTNGHANGYSNGHYASEGVSKTHKNSSRLDSNGNVSESSNGTLGQQLGTLYSSAPEPTSAITSEPIAVIGMSCRYPQADSLREFWELIDSGRNAVEMVPEARFKTDQLNREPKGPFWGNFLRDPRAFDHRFFNLSSREAQSMDPQQRLLLQVAYEAVESAGYSSQAEANVGCYIGVGSIDYEANVASENATAFSAMGTLRAFISGRVSHHFGWKGPSVTFDTACSSSAVAIHNACKALQTKECSMAIAGGVNVITAPNLYQNLSAASFLSPSGASKAFDASGDGYCRGEGAGVLVLKPLSQAVRDEDFILGVISATAVNQGSNYSPITVPDSGSQSELYNRVLTSSGTKASQVSYVEAHGTGTPVGDPIECESIVRAFGSHHRDHELSIGSVKDVIGHTEAASGVAGCIKVLLMMQNGIIPKQPNFSKLNPDIPPLQQHNMSIAHTRRPWGVPERVALVNNYGASGSNAAILLQEYTRTSKDSPSRNNGTSTVTQTSVDEGLESPIVITAKTMDSMRSYCMTLKQMLELNTLSANPFSLSDVSYNLAKKQNLKFNFKYTSTTSSLLELQQKLEDLVSNKADGRQLVKGSSNSSTPKTPSPVILCFGGQTGLIASISEHLVSRTPVLQKHLQQCDKICQVLGLQSLFPGIFNPAPAQDLVGLHTQLFSIQYACAKYWLDAGLEVAALLGHSFGQLTALCVAGSIDLADGLRFVSGRARLIVELWKGDNGRMLSVEGQENEIQSAISQIHPSYGLDIACYNSSRNIVLSGNTESIQTVKKLLKSLGEFKLTDLDNSHAYHSRLMDPIVNRLHGLAKSMTWHQPSIPVETCSPGQTWSSVSAEKVADHTRDSVYFVDAVKRIAGRYPSCIWLEAGSSSPIVPMVQRALPTNREDNLIKFRLNGQDAWNSLSKATSKLWAAGCTCCFLPRPVAETETKQSQGAIPYKWIELPPYQFAKSNHWIEYRIPEVVREVKIKSAVAATTATPELIRLVNDETTPQEAIFEVNTFHDEYQLLVKGHAVLGQSLCPASMYLELAIRGARTIAKAKGSIVKFLQTEQLRIFHPLALTPNGRLFLSLILVKDGNDCLTWTFRLYSQSRDKVDHATGVLHLSDGQSSTPRLRSFQRLLSKSHYEQVMESPDAERLSGAVIYKIFGQQVDYAPYYQGVYNIAARGSEVVGDIRIPDKQPHTITPGGLHPILLDNVLQVAGIHVNCLTPHEDQNVVFICTTIAEIVWGSSFTQVTEGLPPVLRVYSSFDRESKSSVENDIVALDRTTGKVVLALLGVQFTAVAVSSLRKVLSKLNQNPQESAGGASSTPAIVPEPKFSVMQQQSTTLKNFSGRSANPNWQQSTLLSHNTVTPAQVASKAVLTERSVLDDVRDMLSEVIGISAAEVQPSTLLIDLGVDSLMTTEVANDIKKRFNMDISISELQELTNVDSLAKHLQSMISQTSEPTIEAVNGTPPPSEDGVDNRIIKLSRNWFSQHGRGYDVVVEQALLSGFCKTVYPAQAKLVEAYVIEAFAELGCDLRTLTAGTSLPNLPYLPKHKQVMSQFFKILKNAQLITLEGGEMTAKRTDNPVSHASSEELHREILQRYPIHASEHLLLHTTGHLLAKCLSGQADPLSLLFRDADAKRLLEDVYTNAPMFKAGTLFLAQFLSHVLRNFDSNRTIRILELGGGTGGTTGFLLAALSTIQTSFEYTFTDLSPSLVTAAKKKFKGYPNMKYQTLDIEKEPSPDLLNQFDIVISTNCIHATKDLVASCSRINSMLRPDGVLCLLELTQNLFWFDLVFGLLEGWWLFNDGRKHALASETMWHDVLETSGYNWVTWSEGTTTEESNILRMIVASPIREVPDSTQEPSIALLASPLSINAVVVTEQTVPFTTRDSLTLNADIYYPSTLQFNNNPRPVALMIHGGGHVMLSRKDIRPKQTEMLLDLGFLPISIDYRLCPETTLLEGPMTDVLEALRWIRTHLASVRLHRPDIRVSTEHVVAVGWSTGGHLAMSLGWTAPAAGIQPPNAILAFYCPLDYEDSFWSSPNYPYNEKPVDVKYDLWDGISDKPIAGYNLPKSLTASGGWMASNDARSRIALHMNWYGQTLAILIHGLKKPSNIGHNGGLSNNSGTLDLPTPTQEQVKAISPLAQIRSGNYTTSTFIVHPSLDDLIPWQQAQRVHEALVLRGVSSKLRIVTGAKHLFDILPSHRNDTEASDAIREGYEFLASHFVFG